MGTREQNTDYSRNQCTLIIRVDGSELEIPCNYGLMPDEIKAIYPYLAKFASEKVENPAVKFMQEHDGSFSELTDQEYMDALEKTQTLSKYWYNKKEESLLTIAMRVALDIKFKDIAEIQDALATTLPYDRIKVNEIVSSKEADKILKDIDTEVTVEADENERDIEKGSDGDLSVDIYNMGILDDFATDESKALESKVNDSLKNTMNDGILPDRYKSNYKAGGFDEGQISEDGLLDLSATKDLADAIFDGSEVTESTESEGMDNAEEVPVDDLGDEEVPVDEEMFEEHVVEPELEDIEDDSED